MNKTSLADRWLPFPARPGSELHLFCLPHAGAGAATYRSWGQQLPRSITVCPVQPPGREHRFRERPYERLQPMVEDLAEAIIPVLTKPFALFGHSLGAIGAFELARVLRRYGGPQPVHLFLSARIAPDLRDHRPLLHIAPRDQLVAALQRFGGIPSAMVGSDLLDAMLPLLRADLAANETYQYEEGPPLDMPITVFGGTQDTKARPDELKAWRAHTTGQFRLCLIPGGHFFVTEKRDLLIRHILEGLGC
jgi:medium-chain acyl-[acyl-carrier-protein] hydrolase